MKVKRFLKNYYLAAYSFGIPVILLLTVYFLNGIIPFGETSIITGDCTIQYTAYLAYMRELLRGDVSPLYTFSKVLGGDMAGFLSYYLLSPFNVILLFFENIQIQEAVLVLTLLKTGSAGGSLFFYLNKKSANGWYTLLFSTSYALMGYNIAYQNNIMWLDGLVFLPVMVLGLERLVQEKKAVSAKNLLYTIVLSIMLITNYYIGYMLSIFAGIYMLYYLFFDCDNKDYTRREYWKAIGSFCVNSLLAGGIAAAALLPTALSLSGGKAAFDLRELLDFTILYTPGQVFKELFIGNFALKGGGNILPNIYCGIGIVILAVFYFIRSNIPLREKIGSGIVVIIFYLSFSISAFDRVWHGTTVPAGAPHRYSFLFSFFLILLACKGLCAIGEKGIKAGIGIYVLMLITYIFIRRTIDSYVLVNVAVSALFIVCFILINRSYEHRIKGRYSKIVLILVLSELTYNAYCTVGTIHYDNWYEFRENTQQVQGYIDGVKKIDDGWYRMEQYGTNVTMNDAMFFQYNGLWSYSSCEKEKTKRLAGKLGLNDRSWWITYHNEMPASAESLLSLKYIISNETMYQNTYLKLKENKTEGVTIFENPYAMPLGFLVNDEVMNTHMETWDVFALQNDIWKRMTGEREDIYHFAEQEEVYCDNHKIEYKIVAEEEAPIYTCFRNYGLIEEMSVVVNGRQVRRIIPEMQSYRLGDFKKGDIIEISINSETQDISWYDLYFYHENMETLQRYSALLQNQGMTVTSSSQQKIEGKVNNKADEERLLLLTVPDDEGWVILVDGIKQKSQKVLDGFLGIRVPSGEHQLSLYYVPPGLCAGAVISVISICILGIMFSMKNGFQRNNIINGIGN